MTYRVIDYPQPINETHKFIIGAPLFVVSIFCFVFVMVQPHISRLAHTDNSTHSKAGSTQVQNPLSVAAFIPTSTLTTVSSSESAPTNQSFELQSMSNNKSSPQASPQKVNGISPKSNSIIPTKHGQTLKLN